MPPKNNGAGDGLNEVFVKMAQYCAYRERCRSEVMEKMERLAVPPDEQESMLALLEKENLLNEERFSESYAGSKFRLKKWGRLKIRAGLKVKRIPNGIVSKVLEGMDDLAYMDMLAGILEKKSGNLREPDAFIRKNKAARYAISKGYEPELVWELLNAK